MAIFREGRVEKKLVLVVAAALVDADGRILLQQRPQGKSLAGLWEFPGGKIETGETPEDALIRELKEELGISVSSACLAPGPFASAPIDNSHLVLMLFLCRKWDGIPRAIEAPAIGWYRPLEMHALAMPPADRPLIGLIEALV